MCLLFGPDYPNRKKHTQFLDSFVAVWYYEGNVRKSILRYKFYHARQYAPAYGRFLAKKIAEVYPEGFDCLSWVPVSPLRKLTRGYDQSALLAKAVGTELGMVPVPLLKKIRHNRPQSGIAKEAKRRANVLGAYRITDPKKVVGKRILLLDDVLTTGSTAGECARMLKTAGAKEVHCAVLAARK
jgi:ComF family protein